MRTAIRVASLIVSMSIIFALSGRDILKAEPAVQAAKTGAARIAEADKSSLIVWEAFKVYDGQIHAVEAFMRVMPHGTPSGWDPK